MLVRHYISRKYPKCVDLVNFNIIENNIKFAITFGDLVSYVNMGGCQRTISNDECESILGSAICKKLSLFNKYIAKVYQRRHIDRNLNVNLPRDRYPLILSCFDIEEDWGYWYFRYRAGVCLYKISQNEIFYNTLDLLEAALQKERREALTALRPLPIPISKEIEKYFL